ncbi:DMT family transporter [Solimonas soli]|uniref:DMT family transporter n=1 Tax=Solimonas soli TaxID=413479 RepID=UPI0004815BF7|nr:DMT family transporter [Solimonas soli]
MRNDLRRGALHALYAAAAFSATGVCIKAAAATTANEMVVFIRCAVSLLAFAPWLLRHGSQGLRTRRLGGHLWRSVFGVAAMYCFFYAIAQLPLASAMLLTYSTPLWLPFIAWWWLGERPTAMAFPAALIGLAGVALIVHPRGNDFGALGLAGIVGAGSGLLAACAMVSVRRISDSEPAERIVFYFALLATLVSALPLPWRWQTPEPRALLLLIAAGIAATVGQLHLTRAYSWAPAAQVGPFTYASVLFSAALAWLLWGERLDRWAGLGVALVIATCVLISRRAAPRTA